MFEDSMGNVLFDPNQISTDLNNAISAWTVNCAGCTPSLPPPKDCCTYSNYIKVKFSKNKYDFETMGSKAKDIAAVTADMSVVTSVGYCDPPCDQMEILLNQSDAFTGLTDDNCEYSNHFFYTGNIGKYNWLSLTAILMHEIGHLLGFADQYEYENHSNASLISCFHDPGSIMFPSDFDAGAGTTRGLSSDDICMYKKLYCSDLTSGLEDKPFAQDFGIKIFPNPTNSDLINLQFSNSEGLLLNFEIISPIGITILTGEILQNENPKTITLGNLSSGFYFLILKHDGKQEIQKFIINK
jgi:hypothetical protein